MKRTRYGLVCLLFLMVMGMSISSEAWQVYTGGTGYAGYVDDTVAPTPYPYTGPTTTKKQSIAKASVKLSKTVYYYNGKARRPLVTVKLSGKKLVKNRDYTVTYKNNKNPGTATVIIKGKGNYTGTVKKKFTIRKSNLSKYKVTVSSPNPLVYDGTAQKPNVTVKYGSKTLKKNRDYKLLFRNNINAGTATAIVKGVGKYRGRVEKNFKIARRSIFDGIGLAYDENPEDIIYTGKPIQLTNVQVLFNWRPIPSNNYTLKYRNNVEPGKAYLEITGKNNLKDCGEIEFIIQDVFSMPMTGDDVYTSQSFANYNPDNKKRPYRPYHLGVDLATRGDRLPDVCAAADGYVEFVGRNSSDGNGNHVIVKHTLWNQVYYTLYSHMSDYSIIVNRGQYVKKGQKIGVMGNTGNSNGPHLHFAVFTHYTSDSPWGYGGNAGSNGTIIYDGSTFYDPMMVIRNQGNLLR